jgi:hypothetical protein
MGDLPLFRPFLAIPIVWSARSFTPSLLWCKPMLISRHGSRIGSLLFAAIGVALSATPSSTAVPEPSAQPLAHSAALSRPSQAPRHSVTPTVNTTPPVLVAQQSRQRRVMFEPGKYSTTIRDSVLRGTRDVYVLRANQRQTMTVQISSLENNATFDLMAPPNSTGQRRVMRQETMDWAGTLPQSGDYQVVVGPTRGNASYRLTVSIK